MERTLSSYYRNGISKRGLLLMAGFVWFAAGCILINRCMGYLIENSHHILFHFLIGLSLGLFTFVIIFFKLAKKYIEKIIHFNSDKPFILSFSYIRAYFIMALLIGIGFILRRTDYFNNINISIAYICFGFSLVLSSLIFFYNFMSFKKYTDSSDISSR